MASRPHIRQSRPHIRQPRPDILAKMQAAKTLLADEAARKADKVAHIRQSRPYKAVKARF